MSEQPMSGQAPSGQRQQRPPGRRPGMEARRRTAASEERLEAGRRQQLMALRQRLAEAQNGQSAAARGGASGAFATRNVQPSATSARRAAAAWRRKARADKAWRGSTCLAQRLHQLDERARQAARVRTRRSQGAAGASTIRRQTKETP